MPNQPNQLNDSDFDDDDLVTHDIELNNHKFFKGKLFFMGKLDGVQQRLELDDWLYIKGFEQALKNYYATKSKKAKLQVSWKRWFSYSHIGPILQGILFEKGSIIKCKRYVCKERGPNKEKPYDHDAAPQDGPGDPVGLNLGAPQAGPAAAPLAIEANPRPRRAIRAPERLVEQD